MQPNRAEAENAADPEDNLSDTSDGPGDGVLVASEISLGGLDLDTSTSSFLTSSDDDMAISENLRTSDSHSGMIYRQI